MFWKHYMIVVCLGMITVEGKELDSKEAEVILTRHNELRQMVGAANMYQLSYDKDYAKQASQWANKCKWEKGSSSKGGLPYESVGQNMWHSPSTEDLDVGQAVQSWYDEGDDYNVTIGSCSEGADCGQYTQLVWANTELVGCAYKKCKKLKGTSVEDAHFVVCSYGPGGNVDGENPFILGEPCTECGSWLGCQDGLCTLVDDDVTKTPDDVGAASMPTWSMLTIFFTLCGVVALIS